MAEHIRTELRTGAPDAELLESLRRLAAASQAADGAPPFSEQTLVELGKDRRDAGAAPLTIACVWSGENLVGAAAVLHERTDDGGEQTLTELTVDPQHRRRGVGAQLASDLAASVLTPGPRASHRAWAHGGHPGGPTLAAAFRWGAVRELWRMRLDNDAPLPAVELDEGVTLRSFRPGTDEQAWLSANAEAFIDHPEQGQLTMEDLQARMAEDWFDPEGFFLAWSADDGDAADPQLLGFHWTKMPAPEEPGAEQLGEVYAVGVLPSAQGRGLGASLTLAGIEYLRNQGADAVILYVDASNASAAALYKKLGFRVWDIDIQYAPLAETGAGQA
ncbi:mycothiol synthase [Garicola koreensis]|uniref:mycothiol synthase n=1 Tax=Garicola koreensis TaxID=1262554 RepID=UPI0031EC84D6